MMTRRQSRLNS